MNKKSTSNINSEIEKFIINAHQKYKLGADAISKKMALPLNEGGLNVKISRAPIGKSFTKITLGLISPIKEFWARLR